MWPNDVRVLLRSQGSDTIVEHAAHEVLQGPRYVYFRSLKRDVGYMSFRCKNSLWDQS
jgi:hypothetical protein